MNFKIVIAILIILIIILLFYKYYINKLQDELFYNVDNVYPELRKIHKLRDKIMKEMANIDNWNDWPEKELYDNNGTWKIYPLYAFDVWVTNNCKSLPTLTKFIQSTPNIKLAILSKLSPGMKLVPHRGWGKHSNNVLRAHYGLNVPENKCYIGVSDDNREEKQYHKNDDWIVFDDSKNHMAENTSDHDRIVLIIDMERPDYIKKGSSKIGDTKELLEIINYFKKRNIDIKQINNPLI